MHWVWRAGCFLTEGEHDVEGYALVVALQLKDQLGSVLVGSCLPTCASKQLPCPDLQLLHLSATRRACLRLHCRTPHVLQLLLTVALVPRLHASVRTHRHRC